MSQRRLGWEIAWKPVLMLMVTVEDTDDAGEYFRVDGAVASEAVFWAPRGTGRGGNNYSGAGILVELLSGGEALLLAESLSVPDSNGVMDDVKNGEIKTQGKVIDYITEDQEEYYGFDESDFPDPSSEGRVMLSLSYP